MVAQCMLFDGSEASLFFDPPNQRYEQRQAVRSSVMVKPHTIATQTVLNRPTPVSGRFGFRGHGDAQAY
jgi:hypothetical protein